MNYKFKIARIIDPLAFLPEPGDRRHLLPTPRRFAYEVALDKAQAILDLLYAPGRGNEAPTPLKG